MQMVLQESKYQLVLSSQVLYNSKDEIHQEKLRNSRIVRSSKSDPTMNSSYLNQNTSHEHYERQANKRRKTSITSS